MLEAMSLDKKNRAAELRFALAQEVGVMYPGEHWTVAPPMARLTACLEGLA
jgi:hypothetical protein